MVALMSELLRFTTSGLSTTTSKRWRWHNRRHRRLLKSDTAERPNTGNNRLIEHQKRQQRNIIQGENFGVLLEHPGLNRLEESSHEINILLTLEGRYNTEIKLTAIGGE